MASLPQSGGDDTGELDALRDFFENAAVGMHWVDAHGVIVRVNRAELELLGYRTEEYLGRNIIEFHEDQCALEDIQSRLANGETIHNVETSMRAKDGSIKRVVIDASARFVNGVLSQTCSFTREITELRASEKALRETEALYRSLAGAMPALIVTTTPAGEIEDVDDNYREYTGLSTEQARDWASHQVIHPDDLDQSMRVWSNALATNQPMQNEMRLRRHDGSYRWYLVQGMPVYGVSGEILRWVTVNIDIDDRKRAEARDRYLAETTAQLVSPLGSGDLLAQIARLAVPALSDICAIGLFDGSSQTARVETAILDEAQSPHVALIHLRPWRTSPGSNETIEEAIAQGRDIFVTDASPWIGTCAPPGIQRDAAEALGVRSMLCLPLLTRGKTVGMVTFATTISGRWYTERDRVVLGEVAARLSIALENLELYDELRTKAEELRLANAVKDEFLGLISHELRTPLTSIRGNAEVLERRFEDLEAESRKQALSDIRSESERLERIIDNLLLLARLEQGQKLEREPVVVIRVVERVIARHQRLHSARTFEVKEMDRRRPVAFPEGYLDQVIENLISNAEKYSPADAPITVEITRTPEQVSVRVLDRGPGIGTDGHHLFEPFYRASAMSHSAPGLGIGLAVCKRLVEAVGGTIWALPREDGGSEFGFTLPVIDDGDEDLG